MRLPTIEIPKFDGSWEKWLPFRDIFTSMVHNNETLPDIDKLHYLRWVLVGDAHKLIESLEVTNENYQIAWEIMNKRYKGNKAIIQYHIQALINFPCLSKESHSSLRQLVDAMQQHIRTLKRLGQATEAWDTLLIYLFLPKLQRNTRREWESERANKEENAVMEEFIGFLEMRCAFLEALTRTNSLIISKNQQGYSKQQSGKQPNQVQAYVGTENATCPICQNTHRVYECLIFRGMSVQARQEKVKSNGLCYNCLKPFHGKKCIYGACKKCRKHHNTLLHNDKIAVSNSPSAKVVKDNKAIKQGVSIPTSSEREETSVENGDNLYNSLSSCHTRNPLLCVLLSTAIVHVQDHSGKLHECRALLDSGSQPNFISRDLIERLQLPQYNTESTIGGVNNVSSMARSETTTTIFSRFNKYRETLSFLIVNQVASKLPATSISLNSFQIPSNVRLADPTFHIPGKIDMILGSEIFWNLLCVGQIQLGKTKPIFQKTRLGWVVAGSADLACPSKLSTCHLVQHKALQNQIEKFWRIEELQTIRHLTHEERCCEEHFSKTHVRAENGRFIVKIPLKDNHQELGDSYEAAKHRLFTLERKLAKQPHLKQQYDSFICEYLELGHMKCVSKASVYAQDSEGEYPIYYLPHHAVLKPDSDTTSLRVVFDASAKTTSGFSLNDVQMIGSTIQQELFNIPLRFRQHVYYLC